jgi:cytidyltransferase-like protein
LSADKIKTTDAITAVVSKYNRSDKKTGLISGCFDILHIGHIRLFQFAKDEVDILIVGVDNDRSIKSTKGKFRPINNQKTRMDFLSHITLIDYVFPLDFQGKFGDKQSDDFYKNLYRKISPSSVISSIKADRYAESKRKIASQLNIDFIPFVELLKISTTGIEKIFVEQ